MYLKLCSFIFCLHPVIISLINLPLRKLLILFNLKCVFYCNSMLTFRLFTSVLLFQKLPPMHNQYVHIW